MRMRRSSASADFALIYRGIQSYSVDHPPVAKARPRKSVKAYLAGISPRHVRVIQEYAAGKRLH